MSLRCEFPVSIFGVEVCLRTKQPHCISGGTNVSDTEQANSKLETRQSLLSFQC